MRSIGALASGQSPSASEGADGLVIFNAMLASWRLQGLTIAGLARETFGLTSGTQTYTIGSGGVFSRTLQPQTIEGAAILPNGVSTDVEIPIEVLTDPQWAGLTNKAQTGTYARGIHYAKGAALGTVTVWPKPDSSTPDLVLYIPTPFAGFALLTTDLSIADGYEEAYVYNLAVRLAVEYPPDPQRFSLVQRLASESLANIKRSNPKLDTLRLPVGLSSMVRDAYDIEIDG